MESYGNSSERKPMSALAEAQVLIRRIAEPCPAGDSTKAAMRRSWRILKTWSFNRVRDVWNADHRVRLRAAELEQLREAIGARKRAKEKAAHHDLGELRARIARLEGYLQSIDPNFHRETLAALRDHVRDVDRIGGNLDGTVDSGE